MNKWTAIIMAAGSGKRMLSSTPKVLHEVAGEPIIKHISSAMHLADPSQLIIVVPEGPLDAYSAHLDAFGVTFVHQKDPLGTGNAVALSLDKIDPAQEAVIVVNGDAALLTTETVAGLKDFHSKENGVITITTTKVALENAEGLGRIIKNDKGDLVGIKESIEYPQSGKIADVRTELDVNVGLYAFKTKWLVENISKLEKHVSGEYLIGDLVTIATNNNEKVTEFMAEDLDKPIGVNDQEQLVATELVLQNKLRKHWLSVGVSMDDPSTTYFGINVKLGSGISLGHNTVLSGKTIIGSGSKIGPNAVIRDSVIADNVSIGSSYLNKVEVGLNVTIENYNTLREGTNLAENVQIGNHVEIKDSTVGAGSFIRHFSYIGDSILGERVNVGAGVITCNYDGTTKHKTIIEDGAFIGSGTMLVAPLKIGRNAITGAGSVVLKDVEPGVTVGGVPANQLSINKK